MNPEQEALVCDNVKLAIHIARRFAPTFIHYGVELDDVIGTANVGLVRAAKTYKPDKGWKFSTYAGTCIQNELLQTIRDLKRRHLLTNSIDFVVCESIENGKDVTQADIMPIYEDYSHIEIDDFVKQLRPSHRIVLMYAMQGLDQHEIAKAVGISQSYISRIIKQFIPDSWRRVSEGLPPYRGDGRVSNRIKRRV